MFKASSNDMNAMPPRAGDEKEEQGVFAEVQPFHYASMVLLHRKLHAL
jgi:hypothetical protein